jgi:hypothetical protein
MRLSNSISQNLSLQLKTSIALDRGIEQVHEMVKLHEDNLTGVAFIKEMKSRLLNSNQKGFFRRNMPPNDLLREDKDLLERALAFAANRHLGEYRESGHPYLSHVLSTGFILARLGLPRQVVLAGILHDTIEDHPDKNKILNQLYELMPSIAWYVYSVSGPDIKDSVEKDKILNNRIKVRSESAGNDFPKIIKCADGIANLYDLEHMTGKDGRTPRQRQMLFIDKIKKQALPFASEIDQAMILPLRKGKETFSLHQYILDFIDEKQQIIAAAK